MPGPPPSQLDANQVLQHAFIDATGELRVNASVSVGTIVIDQSTSSIRIGDGVNLVTTTTIGPDVGLDVNVINDLELDIDQTEDSIAIGDGTNLFTGTPVNAKNALDVTEISPITKSLIDTTSSSVLYIGETKDSAPLTSAAVWRIERVTITATEVDIAVASTGDFNQIWDDRTILPYV